MGKGMLPLRRERSVAVRTLVGPVAALKLPAIHLIPVRRTRSERAPRVFPDHGPSLGFARRAATLIL